MNVSSVSGAAATSSMAAVAGQVSMYALKKSLDSSKEQASALAQLIEQMPVSQENGHTIDFYA
jgi:hypothetical protein